MNVPLVIVVGGVGGALGSWLRVVVRDECVARGIASWRATVAINLLGSLIAGTCIQLEMWSIVWSVVVAGLLGGFTTFSSMCLDMVVQWQSGRRRDAVAIVTCTMIGAPVVAAVGVATQPPPTLSHAGIASSAVVVRFARGRIHHHSAGLLLIAIGGGIGTAIRIGTLLGCERLALGEWIATLSVNVIGAAIATFAFRSLMALDRDGTPIYGRPRRVSLERLIILGFCGGLTTMSTLSLEIATAWTTDISTALIIGTSNIVGGTALAVVGWKVAAAFYPRREQLH